MSFESHIKKALNIQHTKKETDDVNVIKPDLLSEDNSPFLYPTLIIIPLIIVLIGVFASNIKTMFKIILILFLLFAIAMYIAQTKNVNLVVEIKKFSAAYLNKINVHRTTNAPQSAELIQ